MGGSKYCTPDWNVFVPFLNQNEETAFYKRIFRKIRFECDFNNCFI